MKQKTPVPPRPLRGLLLILLAAVVGTAVWSGLTERSRQRVWNERPLGELKVFGKVPDFSLIERSGGRLQLSDLRGKTWIANLFYTTCTDTCPLQSAEMAKLQSDVTEWTDVKLVSISVDPEHDSPKVLSQYAERYRAEPDRWLLLTGDKEAIYRLAQEGFRLSVASASESGGQDDNTFIHSPRFVLVDREGRIRGYYDSRDPEAIRRLHRDLRTLLGRFAEANMEIMPHFYAQIVASLIQRGAILFDVTLRKRGEAN
jgi:protein SCO1/2